MDLVILAAGMGSRFGGLKQIEPMNEHGEFIIDYSIYDAIKCGFDKVVFIIKEENYDIFRDTIGKRIENKVKVEYVFQKQDSFMGTHQIPEGRVKPWGTGHAILCCKDKVKDDFVIINADDFYGYDAFKVASDFIKNNKDKHKFALVGYKCENTLSENGACKRGVCYVENGNLTHIEESSVEKTETGIIGTSLETEKVFKVEPNQTVSMNMWCLNPIIFDQLEKDFDEFLTKNLQTNPLKCEFLIPTIISEMLDEKLVSCPVVPTNAKWYGVTYKEDKPSVVSALKNMTKQGIYPENLWA